MRRPLSRRTLLRGILGGTAVAIGLPPLEAFFNANGTAMACGGPIPKRFGLFFWGNGVVPDRWIPAGDGEDYEMSDELAPLSPYRSKIAVVTGMEVKVPNTVPHGSGAAGLLSCRPIQSTDLGDTFAGPSIDQIIAAQIGGETLYPSLQTAASDTLGLSYNGPNSRNPAETDPYALYERLFGASFRPPGSDGVVDPKIGLRRSVLDAVMGDVNALSTRVSAADRVRLEQHLDGVRQLEGRLAKLEEDPPDLDACAQPAAPTGSFADVDGRAQISARSRVICDMLAMALACDQTRVFGHYLTEPINNNLFPGAPDGHHNLTHDEPSPQPIVHAITVQCVEELAYLVGALDRVPEADETLLDHCIVLGCTEVSLGRLHSLTDIPLVLAGSGCGSLRTGFHYRSIGAENATSVMLSIVRAMGIAMPDLGSDDAQTSSGLSAIEA
jgi:hypothetical protein